MTSNQIPGAAIVVVKDGEVVYKKGFGLANLETKAKVDPDKTIFRIGSISKVFTAIAALQLVDEGKLDLHRDVNRYLTTFKVEDSFAKPITLSHLLSHSSGLDELYESRQAFDRENLVPLGDFLSGRLRRVRKPGVVPAYSTYGIALAGYLIAKSDSELESYFRNNIWSPLGMDSACMHECDRRSKDVAVGYELVNGKNTESNWEWYNTYPASSINCSVSDMQKFISALLPDKKQKTILQVESIKKMMSRQASGHRSINGFGYGLQENTWNGQKTWDHGGDMAGFSSYLLVEPKNHLGVFVVHHHEGAGLRYKAVSVIADHYFENPTFQCPDPDPQFYAKRSDRFVGSYRWLSNSIDTPTPARLTWTVKANEDNTLSIIGKTFVEIEPNLFATRDGNLRVGFVDHPTGTKAQYLFMSGTDAFERFVE